MEKADEYSIEDLIKIFLGDIKKGVNLNKEIKYFSKRFDLLISHKRALRIPPLIMAQIINRVKSLTTENAKYIIEQYKEYYGYECSIFLGAINCEYKGSDAFDIISSLSDYPIFRELLRFRPKNIETVESDSENLMEPIDDTEDKDYSDIILKYDKLLEKDVQTQKELRKTQELLIEKENEIALLRSEKSDSEWKTKFEDLNEKYKQLESKINDGSFEIDWKAKYDELYAQINDGSFEIDWKVKFDELYKKFKEMDLETDWKAKFNELYEETNDGAFEVDWKAEYDNLKKKIEDDDGIDVDWETEFMHQKKRADELYDDVIKLEKEMSRPRMKWGGNAGLDEYAYKPDPKEKPVERPSKLNDIFDAASTGDVASVRYWVYKNPDIVKMVRENDSTPLQYAVHSNQFEVVKVLVPKMSNIDPVSGDFSTPLSKACQLGFNDIAKYLLEQGANPNNEDFRYCTPLFYAVTNDSFEIAKLLLEKGADPNVKNIDKKRALHVVKSEKMKELLIEHGAYKHPPKA